MKKYGIALCLALCLTALLGGCAFRQVDELYTLPKLPGDFQNLQSKIEEVTTGTGAEYSAPLWATDTQTNTQPVQFQDLDGDGTLEAIAFFKVPADEKPLKIYIFRQTETGYEVGAVVEGDGTAISYVSYENLNSSPAKELLVSWQKSAKVNTLAVYALDRYEVTELMSSSYTGYSVTDIDMDNQKEILVIHVDTVDGTNSRVECYDADKTSIVMVGGAPLTQGVTGLSSDAIKTGFLRGGAPIPALFVTSNLGEGIVTDIFAWKDGDLKNVTLSEESGVSDATYRMKDKAKATDINGDTVLELPVPVSQPANGTAVAPTLDAWYQYDLNGVAQLVYTTYHNFEDNWFFVLPDQWVGSVAVTQDSAGEEKRTVFSRWQGEKAETFLTIYRLTGPNRHMRARLGTRFTLSADDTTIYCAEFTLGGWSSGLDEAGVKEHFKISQTE